MRIYRGMARVDYSDLYELPEKRVEPACKSSGENKGDTRGWNNGMYGAFDVRSTGVSSEDERNFDVTNVSNLTF
ncbi:MAG TPA: hypothetical protein VJK51_00700 [Candidatus Nanoarchaeia archaeon]|nr:hypothetical protein [Candidatus Nanoarchaeia archaeon]